FADRWGIECVDAPSSGTMTLANVSIDVWDGAAVALASSIYATDCNGSQHYEPTDGFGVTGFTDGGGNTVLTDLDGLF
ncbi:MAG: hypothetical protein Q7S00_06960, partial [bacterium]|nr:hypothetical protein [bacterium]